MGDGLSVPFIVSCYDGIYGEAPPERGRDFTCCEVCERVVKTVISVGKKAQEC